MSTRVPTRQQKKKKKQLFVANSPDETAIETALSMLMRVPTRQQKKKRKKRQLFVVSIPDETAEPPFPSVAVPL